MLGGLLAQVLLKAPAKMASTVAIGSGMVVGMFAFVPDLLVDIQGWADSVADWAKANVPLENQPKALFNTLVNEMTVLSLVVMVAARSVVEIIAQAGGAVFGSLLGGGRPAYRDPGYPHPEEGS